VQTRSSEGLAAPALAVVGGILVVVGSLITWAEASVGLASFSASGIDGWEGKVTIGGGAALLFGGISAFLGRAQARTRMRSSALVGGLAASGVAIYTALTARDQIVDSAVDEIVAQVPGTSVEEARSTLDLALDGGLLTVTLQIGIWLVIVGGIVGVLAAVAAISGGGAATTADTAGSGLVGWASPAAPPAPVSDPAPSWMPRPGPEPPSSTPPPSSVWAPPLPAPPSGSDGQDDASTEAPPR
jgi:hypothetical protein